MIKGAEQNSDGLHYYARRNRASKNSSENMVKSLSLTFLDLLAFSEKFFDFHLLSLTYQDFETFLPAFRYRMNPGMGVSSELKVFI